MTPLAYIDAEQRDGHAIATVRGEIDASNASVIDARLRELVVNSSHLLVVDLSATTYLDSAAIALLYTLADDLRSHQQELRIAIGDETPVRRMLSLTGLDRAVRTADTVDAVLA